MKSKMFAGLLAAAVLGAVFTIPAEAGCRDKGTCSHVSRIVKKHTNGKTSHKKSVVKSKKTRAPSRGTRRSHVAPASSGQVVGLIKSMAPAYGVPTWFALRIAKAESNYNPNARGSAGELGVFQLKCATAKGIGYSGKCSGLLDARTNVKYGLKHLSLAVKSSRGNLRLAASKHNGGLGRKSEVRGYVALVF